MRLRCPEHNFPRRQCVWEVMRIVGLVGTVGEDRSYEDLAVVLGG